MHVCLGGVARPSFLPTTSKANTLLSSAALLFCVALSHPAHASSFADSPAAAVGTCSTSLSTFADPKTAPVFAATTPSGFYVASIVTLDIHGSNLDPTWTILLCPKSTKPKSTLPSVSALEKTSTKTHLKALITAPPGTTGSYAVYVADTTGKVYDTSAVIVINPSADSKYIACASPQGTAPTNTNLQCSFSPLSYQVAYDSFGKGVADRFVVVYVDIINKNHDLEFLLQDVRAGFPDYVVSSYDKKVPQDVSIKREQFSARAIIFRLTSATASVVSGSLVLRAASYCNRQPTSSPGRRRRVCKRLYPI